MLGRQSILPFSRGSVCSLFIKILEQSFLAAFSIDLSPESDVLWGTVLKTQISWNATGYGVRADIGRGHAPKDTLVLGFLSVGTLPRKSFRRLPAFVST